MNSSAWAASLTPLSGGGGVKAEANSVSPVRVRKHPPEFRRPVFTGHRPDSTWSSRGHDICGEPQDHVSLGAEHRCWWIG